MAREFSMRQFVKNGILNGVASGAMPPWKASENALRWFEKGVLTDEDLIEIDAAQEAREAEIQRKAAEMKAQTEMRIEADTAIRAVKMVSASTAELDAPVTLMSVVDTGEQSPEARSAAGHERVRVPRRPPKGWRRFRVRGGAAWRRVSRRRTCSALTR